MKNQYFGDINDYRKYGLLRMLCGKKPFNVGVCWMLTHNDDRTDGNSIRYLREPELWKTYDPTLFDFLGKYIRNGRVRSVSFIERSKIIPSAKYYSEILFSHPEKRTEYFRAMISELQTSDLIFFDPDNGLEVKSVRYGRKNSHKYLYWNEVRETFTVLHSSILVYQHFPRVKREEYIQRMREEIFLRLGVSKVITFSTSRVLFLLILQQKHEVYFQLRAQEIERQWSGQIIVAGHHSHEKK